jgi:hypothetical protein
LKVSLFGAPAVCAQQLAAAAHVSDATHKVVRSFVRLNAKVTPYRCF